MQTSQYSTGESPPIKAGHREILPHLETSCTRFNTSARRSTRPSAGPERSQLLQILPSLTVRQFFSISAYFFLLSQHWRTPSFFPCANIFVCAKVLACANIFVCAKVLACTNVSVCIKVLACVNVFGCANVFVHFCWRLYFCVFYLHSYLIYANNLLAQMF